MKYIEERRELEVYGSFDTVIVGGGVTGWAAAVASARGGADTLIIERFPFFGGTATASLMACIVGFRNQVKPDNLQTTKGIGEELILRLLEEGGADRSRNAYESTVRSNKKGDLSYNFTFDTEKFKYVTLKMAVDAGVKILFHTWFSDVIMGGDSVKGVIVENKSGRQAIYAKNVIDASGDGDVAYRAGIPFWQIKKDESHRLEDVMMYKIGGFPPNPKAKGCLFGDTMVLWGPSPGMIDATDSDALTQGEIDARLGVYRHLEDYKKDNPDLEGAYVLDTGALLGIRQTRFFECEYQITGEDVLAGVRPEDTIAVAANPVIRYYGYRRFLEHEGYGIPYRCMLPKRIDNLLIAGRCMCSDQVAYESWRAMAHLLAVGEAAGTAACMAGRAPNGGIPVREVDIPTLQELLRKNGAELG